MYINRLVEAQLTKSLKNRKVLLLLGARQVGKTTLIEHILKKRAGQMLNMDIAVDYARVTAAAHLAPHEAIRSLGGKELLIIDEAHRVPDIGRITKGWYDAHVKTKIILLGSSSQTLLDNASAELAGRNEKLWVTPLLFQEVLQQQSWFTKELPPAALQQHFADQVQALLLQRLVYGSYPEAYVTDNPEQYLTNLTSDYLLKDIFTSSLVRSPEDVRRLLLELTQEIGNTVSVNQLATRLKLSRQTVQRYLDLLEGIFVIFSVPAYCTNPTTEISKSYKYYFWDNGVKNALQREWVVSDKRSDIGVLWENWVMAELFKLSRTLNRQEEIFFWQSRNGSGVDLVIKQGSELFPFEICFDEHHAKSSRSFSSTYKIPAQHITPQNVLEVLL